MPHQNNFMAKYIGKMTKENPTTKQPAAATTVENSEISINQFLDFLKAAYQVHGNLEGVFLEEGMKDTANWIKAKELATTEKKKVAKEKPSLKESDSKFKDVSTLCDASMLQNKLSEILNEGLLDSVLPYMVPSSSTKKTSKLDKITSNNNSMMGITSSNSCSIDSMKKRNSDGSISSKKGLIPKKNDSEVEIHVCDELKHVRKDFRCNQQLLTSQMGYFAAVTANASNANSSNHQLHDMEISVHCDIGIFEWLMSWVKRDSLLPADRPSLSPACAIPVLVSAAFLQMEPLLVDCLLYCHSHLNEILRTSASVACLNDAVVGRLAALYTNGEVEAIRDRRDKVQSRLYCKLIESLCEVEPEAVRGHYCTLATVYRCKNCQQIIVPALASRTPCIPSAMRLLTDGSVAYRHIRDTHWSLTEHVSRLHRQLLSGSGGGAVSGSGGSWRKVYWRLWGDAHHLYCAVCKRYFPTWQIGWCRHHPDPAQFFTLEASSSANSTGGGSSRAPLPVGRYPCCGERAYRFQLLDERGGCQFRDHTPDTKKIRDASILSMLQIYRSLIASEPPQLVFPDRLTRLVAKDENDQDEVNLDSRETFWWQGIEILPARERFGLLGSFVGVYEDEDGTEEERRERDGMGGGDGEGSNDNSDETQTSGESKESSSESSSESDDDSASESAMRRPQTASAGSKVHRKKPPKNKCKLWQQTSSARSNQDIQRSNEEAAFKRIHAIVARRTEHLTMNNNNSSGDGGGGATGTATRKHRGGGNGSHSAAGGLWVKLESEWRENYQQQVAPPKAKNIYTGRTKLKTTRLL